MLHRAFPLRSLSAALVLSTSFTAPVMAVDQTLTGNQTGPISISAPFGTLTNAGTITASSGSGALELGGNPAHFEKVINTGTITATGTTAGISAGVAIESFLNSGSIVSDNIAIGYNGLFTDSMMTNLQGGLIEGDNGAVFIHYGLNTFVNAGTMRSTAGSAFGVNPGSIYGYVGTFTNEATGQIDGASDALKFSGGVGTLNNYGLIESTNQAGVSAISATTFTNNAGGIIRSTNGTAVAFNNSSGGTLVTTFTNNGTLRGAVSGASFTNGSVGTFTNGSTGHIYGGGDAVIFNQNVSIFDNFGWIEATASGDGVSVVGMAGTFTNQTGATIKSATGKAVDFDGAVTTFVNNGTIESGYKGIDLDSPTGSFTNTGTIKGGTGQAIDAASNRIETFINSGTISSTGSQAILAGGFGTFTNAASGVIESSASWAVYQSGAVDSFINRGRIAATPGSVQPGVRFASTVGNFYNSGLISSNGDAGVSVFGRVSGTFLNDVGGTLRGEDYGAYFENGAAALENRGTIEGVVGLVFSDNASTGSTVINSGTIKGFGGKAIDFGDTSTNNALDDVLKLRGASRIQGSIDFANGNDTLDVSGLQGGAVLTVASLENVVSGNRLVNQSLTSGNGTVNVLDATGITSSGPTTLGQVAGAISGEIAGALGGQAGSFAPTEPMGYAPSRPVGGAEAAADELATSSEPTGPEIWGKVFGGVVNKSSEYNAVLGGIVAGSHTAVDASTRLGGVISVSGSRFVTAGNGQTLTSTIGAAGLYGSTDLDGPVLSYSVLGGFAANHSDRSVTAAVTETARADFASWFLSPELGVSIPVPLLEGTETTAGFKVRYVGGGVGSYTETGSSQNLTVGTAAVHLLDGRIELTSNTEIAANDFGAVMLYATAGVMGQQNFGSSVSIATFGTATTPAAFAYGAYADLTLDAPIGPTTKASASTGLELRSDGLSSVSANLGLSAAF